MTHGTLLGRSSLGRVVEQDGLNHAREDLGHMDAHDLRDHLREVDARLQRLSLDEQIVGELVELPHDLQGGGRDERERESTCSVINNQKVMWLMSEALRENKARR